ncbi:YitT family protein [Proteiniclasticum sp. C24MP]|uniref:YczE/YyaS/YitT family protein n=1 Tax=Proteiniclasticum sp. C24MP TaxID=3374101 RepID=UPI0037550EFC
MTIVKKTGIYILGLFVLALGISVSVKSNLGVSPVSSLPYVLSRIVEIEMGYFTMAVFISFIVVQLFILRREFRILSSIQILVSIAFGYFVNLSNFMLRNIETPDPMILRVVLAVSSAALCGLGIFLYIAPSIMPLPGEGLTEAISYKTGKPFSRIKVYFDLTMVVFSLVFSLGFLGRIDGIGIGTLISALLIGKFVGIFSKLLKEKVQMFLGNPDTLIAKAHVQVAKKSTLE